MVRNGLYTRCMLVSSFQEGTSKNTLVYQITCPPLLTLLTKCHSARPSRWRKHLSLLLAYIFLTLILPTKLQSGACRDQPRLALVRFAELSQYYKKVLMRRLNLHQLHENRQKSRTIMLKYFELCSSMRSLVVCLCCLYEARAINWSSVVRMLWFVLESAGGVSKQSHQVYDTDLTLSISLTIFAVERGFGDPFRLSIAVIFTWKLVGSQQQRFTDLSLFLEAERSRNEISFEINHWNWHFGAQNFNFLTHVEIEIKPAFHFKFQIISITCLCVVILLFLQGQKSKDRVIPLASEAC